MKKTLEKRVDVLEETLGETLEATRMIGEASERGMGALLKMIEKLTARVKTLEDQR